MIPQSDPIQPKPSTSSPSAPTPPAPAYGKTGEADAWKAMFPTASPDELEKMKASFYQFAGDQIKKDNERALKQIKEQRKYL